MGRMAGGDGTAGRGWTACDRKDRRMIGPWSVRELGDRSQRVRLALTEGEGWLGGRRGR